MERLWLYEDPKPKPPDLALCGKAPCGCTHHAERGEPCMHDLQFAFRQQQITHRDYMDRMQRLHPR